MSKKFINLHKRAFSNAEVGYGLNAVATVSFNEETGSIKLSKRNTMSDKDESALSDNWREELAKKVRSTTIMPETNPPKSIFDLSDEQIIEIGKLAIDYEGRFYVKTKIDHFHNNRKERIYVGCDFGDGDGTGLTIFPNMCIQVDEGWGYYNQYQIFELFRTWGVKPI